VHKYSDIKSGQSPGSNLGDKLGEDNAVERLAVVNEQDSYIGIPLI
jgi:hypothetical protein